MAEDDEANKLEEFQSCVDDVSLTNVTTGGVDIDDVHLQIESRTDLDAFWQEIHERFLQNVDPEESGLLDHLYAEGILTDTDKESLSGKDVTTNKKQARKLLYRRLHSLSVDRFRETFPFLLKRFPHVVMPSRFVLTPSRCAGGSDTHPLPCGCCRCALMSDRPQSILDLLFKCGAVNPQRYRELNDDANKLPSKDVWKQVFRVCGGHDDSMTSQIAAGLQQIMQNYDLGPAPANMTELVKGGLPCTCPTKPILILPGCGQDEDDEVKFQREDRSQYLGSDDPDRVLIDLPSIIDRELKQWADIAGLEQDTVLYLFKERFTSIKDIERLAVKWEDFKSRLHLPVNELLKLEDALKKLTYGQLDPSYRAWGLGEGLSDDTLLELFKQGLKSKDDLAKLTPGGFQDYKLCLQTQLTVPQFRTLENIHRKLTVVPGLSAFLNRGEKVRIMAVGNSKVGKSSTCNNLLGPTLDKERVFHESVYAQSKTDHPHLLASDDEAVQLMDTPGFFGTNLGMLEVAVNIAGALICMSPGPSVILYVVKVGEPYTNDDFDNFTLIKFLLGSDITRHMIVVFTHADVLKKNGKTIDDYIENAPSNLKEVMEQCGNRYVPFDNKDGHNEAQLQQLARLIQKVTAASQAHCGKAYYVLQQFSSMSEEILKQQMDGEENSERVKNGMVKDMKRGVQNSSIELRNKRRLMEQLGIPNDSLIAKMLKAIYEWLQQLFKDKQIKISQTNDDNNINIKMFVVA